MKTRLNYLTPTHYMQLSMPQYFREYLRELLFSYFNHASLALIASNILYLNAHVLFSDTGKRTEFLPIMYLFPLQTSVLLRIGTNHMTPMAISFIGQRK